MSKLSRILATEFTPKRPRPVKKGWVQVPSNFLLNRVDAEELSISYVLSKTSEPNFEYKLVLSDGSVHTNGFTNDRQGWHNKIKQLLNLPMSYNKDFNNWIMKTFPIAEPRKK